LETTNIPHITPHSDTQLQSVVVTNM